MVLHFRVAETVSLWLPTQDDNLGSQHTWETLRYQHGPQKTRGLFHGLAGLSRAGRRNLAFLPHPRGGELELFCVLFPPHSKASGFQSKGLFPIIHNHTLNFKKTPHLPQEKMVFRVTVTKGWQKVTFLENK